MTKTLKPRELWEKVWHNQHMDAWKWDIDS